MYINIYICIHACKCKCMFILYPLRKRSLPKSTSECIKLCSVSGSRVQRLTNHLASSTPSAPIEQCENPKCLAWAWFSPVSNVCEDFTISWWCLAWTKGIYLYTYIYIYLYINHHYPSLTETPIFVFDKCRLVDDSFGGSPLHDGDSEKSSAALGSHMRSKHPDILAHISHVPNVNI